VKVDEVLLTSVWRPNLLVAERYRDRSVLLVGDAGHQFIPTGGYGMNTGVGDAVDAAWKVAALERGWGGDALIDSYEIERRPVGQRNRDRSARHAGIIVTWPGVLEGSGAVAADTFLQAEQGENESFGIELGAVRGLPGDRARWQSAPAVGPDGRASRNAWVTGCPPSSTDGQQVLDLLGPGFTPRRHGPGGSRRPVTSRGRDPRRRPACSPSSRCAMPSPRLYERRLVLVRPGGYVAWRGDALPEDVGAGRPHPRQHPELSTPARRVDHADPREGAAAPSSPGPTSLETYRGSRSARIRSCPAPDHER
jgi:hypothetical protein